MPVHRLDPRQGYDLWADAYDATPNPVVRLDERVSPGLVRPAPGERILDAGCGTGRYFPALRPAECRVFGLDFSLGMLRVARRKHPGVPLVLADLQRTWPFRDGAFDAVLCALVGEHLQRLDTVFGETRRVLVPGGRVVFSVYHPAMAEAGKEANFWVGEVEVRLGAERHSVRDYTDALTRAGFEDLTVREFRGDAALAAEVASGSKFVDFPVLLVYQASTPV